MVNLLEPLGLDHIIELLLLRPTRFWWRRGGGGTLRGYRVPLRFEARMQWEWVGVVVELALHADEFVTAHLWIGICFAPEGDVTPEGTRLNGAFSVTPSADVQRAINDTINHVLDGGWAQIEGKSVVVSSHVEGNMDHLVVLNAQTGEKICPNIGAARPSCTAEDLKVNLNPGL